MTNNWSSLRGRMLLPHGQGSGPGNRGAGRLAPPAVPPPDHAPDNVPADTIALGWFWNQERQEWLLARIPDQDRRTHLYIVGSTGLGKTKFLEHLIGQDIERGAGFGVVDPHGDLTEEVKGFLVERYRRAGREKALRRVVLVDPTDPHYTITFNVLERLANVSPVEQALELVGAFKRIWEDSWGPRMEDMLRNSLIALGEAGLTVADLPQLITSRQFRRKVLEKVTNPVTRAYFARFDQLPARLRLTWSEPVMNKINAFLADDRIRQMLSHPTSSFNLREIMDNRGILLVKLDRGRLRESADLLGSLLMAKIQMAAFSRSDIPLSQRVLWHLYVDEFQRFATETFAILLSESRKFAIDITMANQTLEQIPPEVRAVVLGNVGLQVCFRISRDDAEHLAREGFSYSGYQVKTADLYGPRYWSLGEEWERHTEELQRLAPRRCYVAHKLTGGMVPLHTVTVNPPWETLGVPEIEWPAFLDGLEFGRDHLVPRSELLDTGTPEDGLSPEERDFLQALASDPTLTVSALYKAVGVSARKGNQLREGLKGKGLLLEIETRLGRGGRLAKYLVPTFDALEILGQDPPPGRGSPLHRHVQRLVLDEAIKKGYQVELEKELEDGNVVDAHVEKENERVAVEVAVFSRPQREIEHIASCLAAGYDRVVCVFATQRLLERTHEAMAESIPEEDWARVQLVLLEKLAEGMV